MLYSLKKDLFVGQVGLYLPAALLENLGHDLGPKLICRVCEYICNFKYDAVEELGILEGACWLSLDSTHAVLLTDTSILT